MNTFTIFGPFRRQSLTFSNHSLRRRDLRAYMYMYTARQGSRPPECPPRRVRIRVRIRARDAVAAPAARRVIASSRNRIHARRLPRLRVELLPPCALTTSHLLQVPLSTRELETHPPRATSRAPSCAVSSLPRRVAPFAVGSVSAAVRFGSSD